MLELPRSPLRAVERRGGDAVRRAVASRVRRSLGLGACALALLVGLRAEGQTTYYVNASAAVNVGVDGSTNMTTLQDRAVTGGSSNQNRAITNTTAPSGTTRWRIREGATDTRTNQEFLRAYTPVFAAATTIAANATAYADFYLSTTGTSAVAKASLYEYNDTTGIVGAAKGTASFTANAGTSNRQTMNNVSFGNAAFSIAAGNRLLVVYLFDMNNVRPAYLWGQAASGTPSGYQSFTVTASAATPSTTAAGTVTAPASSCSSITVNAPYTNDGNANNTLSYRYRTPTGTGAWVGPTARTHSASPYNFAITGLASGTYDVEVTYVDTDGVTGTATQTVSNISVGLNCTAAGTASATANSCSQVTASAPFTGDANANGTVAFSRGTAVGGPFTSVTGCTAVGGTSPRSCVDTTVAASTTYYYRVVYSDADGVTGTATQVTAAVSTPACSTPPVTTGTPTGTVNSCTQITVSAPFTGDTNTNSTTTVERGPATTGPWTAVCSGLTGASPRSCAASGLTNASTYYFRVTFADADGVSGTNPQTIGPFTTTDCRVTPGTPTASATSCSTASISAPFTGDTNGNSTATFGRGTAAGGPFTTVCSAVTGASPKTCSDSGLAASTTYYYQVTFADADGVSGTNPQVTTAMTTPACSVNNTTIGTVAVAVASCSSVRVTATFTGDGDQDGTTTIQYGAGSAPGVWTGACTLSGPSPRQCTVFGLSAATLYSFRASFADADGVVGTNPTAGVTATTTACGGDTVAPTITVLAPSKNAVLAGADTVKVQVWDAGGLAASNPVQAQVDGTAPAGFTLNLAVNANYSCGTSCGVYQYALPAQAAGAHYIAVRATDGVGNVAVVTIPFRAVAATTGAGNLLRRTAGSQLCLDCHNLQTHNAQATSTNYGNWSNDCATCHTPHATRNIGLVREQIDTPNSGRKAVDFRASNGVAANGHATPTASGNGVNVCEVCHTRTKNSDGTARARNDAATDWTKHYTTSCTGCHSHAKGFAAGESEGGVTCKGCHADIWNNMQAAAAKTSRHTLAIDTFTDDAVAWGNPLSSNAAAVRSCLNMCHHDHPHTAGAATHEYNTYKDATDNASRVATTRDTATKAKTDFDNAATNGGLCISCHRNPVESGANPANPAIAQAAYSASAHNYSANALGTWQYGLHDGSKFDRNCTKCHAGRTEKAPSASAIPFQAVHWSDDASLLAGTKRPAGAPAVFVCYNCHGNGTTGANYSNKDLATVFAKTYGHPANADATHDTVSEEANASWGNALAAAARHSNCQDCHDPHGAKAGINELSQATTTYTTGTASFTNGSVTVTGQGTTWAAGTHGTGTWFIRNNADGRWYRVTAVASATSLTIETAYAGTTAASSAYTLKLRAFTNLAGPTLEAGWGAQLTTMPTAAWDGTHSGSFTKKAIVSGTDIEATLCFKCHSSYYWGQQSSGAGTGTAAFATTGTVTGTGTSWNSQMIGMSIKSNANTQWFRIKAVASATSLTVVPSPAAAIAAGAYTLATATQGDPSGTAYTTGTAAFTAGNATVTGTGTTWVAATHAGWVIRNGGNGKWYRVLTVASGTSLTVAPVPDTSFSGAYTLAVSQTDQSAEFATTNQSYHPVLGALPATDPGTNGSSRLTAAQLTNGWTPGATMSCSDCHGNDSVSPAAQGPHGSAIRFVLRPSRNSTYTSWGQPFTGGTATLANNWATSFCRNCHPINEDNNWSGNGAHGDHDTRTAVKGCYNCHILVPHGGKMSRLIGDNNGTMPARYAYQGVIGNMFIQSFTKTTPAAYSKSNCQSATTGCTTHGTAASENW